MDKLPGVPIDENVSFEDLELAHKNKPKVSGEAYGPDNTAALNPLEKKNMADLAMERLARKNGQR